MRPRASYYTASQWAQAHSVPHTCKRTHMEMLLMARIFGYENYPGSYEIVPKLEPMV